MNRRTHNSVFEIVMVAAVIAIVVATLWPNDARASGDRITQSNDNNAQTTGDVNVSDSSDAVAFGHALGDVDINDCQGSEQWGSVIVSRQYLKLNLWCAGLYYDSVGLHAMAARVRCEIREIGRLFDSPAECRYANTVSAPPDEPVSRSLPIEAPDDDEEEDTHAADIEALRASVAALEAENEAREREQARAASRARQAAEARRAEEEAEQQANADLLERYQQLTEGGS